ncbi:MAG: nucleoid occlusion factor SlmA [Brachymonas sp.]|jgi:TetR/AcrR family transcriptional regulator
MSEPIEDTPQDPSPARKRPKPGERRLQILQTLAAMLEAPGAERITTAALAAKIGVSEAALYRHFASKAQMFEGLLDFIEQSCLGLVQQIRSSELNAPQQAQQIVLMLLQFAEKNPGMARVMVGDALVLEHERLNQRMNSFFDKVELHLKDILYPHASASGHPTPTLQAQLQAQLLTALVLGQMQRFVRSHFRRKPTERLTEALAQVLH